VAVLTIRINSHAESSQGIGRRIHNEEILASRRSYLAVTPLAPATSKEKLSDRRDVHLVKPA